MHRPRSCHGGQYIPASIGKSSRNASVWQKNQSASLRYRVRERTYGNLVTPGSTFAVRQVKLFQSACTRASYQAQAIDDQLNTLSTEMDQRGFNLAGVKYQMVFHTDAQATSCPGGGSGCTALGVAYRNGNYGFAVRFLNDTAHTTVRQGCAGMGDVLLMHEGTHMVANVYHTTDSQWDLMNATYQKERNFKTDPATAWDVGRNDYHTAVRNSAWIIPSYGSATSLYTCT